MVMPPMGGVGCRCEGWCWWCLRWGFRGGCCLRMSMWRTLTCCRRRLLLRRVVRVVGMRARCVRGTRACPRLAMGSG